MSSWQERKAQGNSAYASGKTEEACSHWTACLQDTALPAADRATLLCNRAQAYLKLGKNEAAVEDCTSCLSHQPGMVKAHFRR
jgi:hypothetical protein